MQFDGGDLNLAGLFSGGGGGYDLPLATPSTEFGGVASDLVSRYAQPGAFGTAADFATRAAPSLFDRFSDVAGRFVGGAEQGLSALGKIAKGVLPVAQIGGAVMGGISSARAASNQAEQARLQKRALELQERSAERAATTAAGPLTQFGETELRRAEAGQIDPAQQAQIDNWKQAAKQKIRDFFAKNNIADSDMLAREEGLIDQQGEAMRADILNAMKTGGVSALTAGGGVLTGAAGAAGGAAQTAGATQDQLTALIAEANRAIAGLTAGATA